MIFTGIEQAKNEDRTYGNSSFYLITEAEKHDFVCSFFFCVIFTDSSTPTSTHSFKHVAILQIEHAVTELGRQYYYLAIFSEKCMKLRKFGQRWQGTSLASVPCPLAPSPQNSPMVLAV